MKKTLIIIMLALISGIAISFFVYFKINRTFKIEEDLITVFQVGVFKNKINALSEAKKYNGIVHNDKNYYRVYIAAYQNDEIINKMKKYYDNKGIVTYLKKIRTSEDYLNTINKYENLLQNSNDEEIYPNLNKLLINKLEEHL